MLIKREHCRWASPHLHREMDLLIFGHSGAKVLVFPTRDGRFHEYEDMRVVQALAPKIEAGLLQLYCVESMAGETFYCWWRQPAHRVTRWLEFERYILDEVLPFMEERNPHPCLIAHGCSLGAYQAANLAFRHPAQFQKLCAFSGRYDLTLKVEHFSDLLDGHYDDDVYYNMPSHFLPRIEDEHLLEDLRRMDIVLVIGRDDPFLANNVQLSHALTLKGVPHRLHVWDGRAHQGHHWRRMAALYL